MKPEEINKAIAEKIFNYTFDEAAWCIDPEHPGWPTAPHDMPDYSTDISAAWQVVEKMREKGFKPKMWADGDDYVFAFFSSSFECKGMGQSLSPETAICLAALKAVS